MRHLSERMKERQQAPAGRSMRWFLATGLVFLTCLVGLARLEGIGGARGGNASEAHADQRIGQAVAPGAPQVEPVGDGWWETRSSIYGGTPTRALFRLPGEDASRATEISARVWSEFDRLGRVFSSFDATTEVGRINAAKEAGTIPLSADLHQVLVSSMQLFGLTDGAFDPTIWPIRTLWHAAVAAQQPPTDAEISAALGRVGLDRVRLIETGGAGAHAVVAPGGVQFDFGGIAKGYAVDRVEALLRGEGVSSGLIELGGEISAFGNDDGEPWRIGVQHPRDDQAVWGVVTSRGEMRVSTSGNYQQPLIIAGRTYYHVMDPRTGQPVSTVVESVTTMDVQGRATSAVLDGAATAIAVLGPDAGLQLARRLGIDALILVHVASDEADARSDEPRELMTEGFRARFHREGT